MNNNNQNCGIDYGNGLTNIDHKTSIRYGVINQSEVLQAWADSADPVFPESENEEDIDDFIEPDGYTYDEDGYVCEQFQDDSDIFICKSPYYTYCKLCSPCAPGAGYLMDYFNPNGKAKEQINLIENIAPLAIGEAIKSHAEKAGYIKAYCFGHDWFDDDKAPYPVFSVETDELISA